MRKFAPLLLLLTLLLLICGPLYARSTDTEAPPADEAAPEVQRPADVPIPDKIPGPEEEPPTVTIRREGDLVIEEYRQGGQLTMVKVTPKNGIAYTYLDTDGDGRLEGDPDDGPVSPVFYTIYEWE